MRGLRARGRSSHPHPEGAPSARGGRVWKGRNGASASSATASPSASLRAVSSIGEPCSDVGTNDEPVDHHVDVVVELLVERGRRGDLVENAVDVHALEAVLHQFGEFLPVFALAPAHERREQIEPRALRQRHHAVDHLRDGLALDRQAGRGRIGNADSRPQQAHIVVDFGDGATVERGFLEVVFCSIEIAGDSPSIWSTSGFCISSRNWRA